MKLKTGQYVSMNFGDDDWQNAVVLCVERTGLDNLRGFAEVPNEGFEKEYAACISVAALLFLDEMNVGILASYDGTDWTPLWWPPESPADLSDLKHDRIAAVAKFQATGIKA